MKGITRFLLVAVFATTLFGCSSNADTGEKKGIALARANWNAGDGVVFVDVDGNRIIDSKQFNFAGKFSEGLCVVADKETGLCGFINEKGELVIPCNFPNPSNYVRFRGVEPRERARFHCGYARMGTSDGCVLIDRNGNTVLDGFVAIDWDGDVAIVCKDNVYEQGLYSMDGKEIVPIGSYGHIRFIGEDMLCGYRNDKPGYDIFDKEGTVMVDDYPFEDGGNLYYSAVGKYVDGYVTVKMDNGSWRVINKKGHVAWTYDKYYLDKKTFDGKMPEFSDGLTIADGRICNSIYESAFTLPEDVKIMRMKFEDGMLAVFSGSISQPKKGFVNTKGEVSVPCIYDEVEDFSDGLAYVKDKEGWHIVDKQGTVLGTLADKDISDSMLGPFCAERSVIGERTVVDKNGNILEMPGVAEIGNFYYSGSDNSDISESF